MRLVKEKEVKLIEYLIAKANLRFDEKSKEELLVEEMKDGGMGSLTLYPSGVDIEDWEPIVE